MPRYAAFLRGINVGNRRATGERLRTCVQARGFDEVASFRNSGNVVFGAGAGVGATKLAATLEAALAEDLGFEVPVFVRSAAQMRAIAAQRPFTPKQLQSSKGKVQVVLLAKKPTAKQRQAILDRSTSADRLELDGSELYWLPQGGLSESELGMKGTEELAGRSTVRTKGTIEQMTAKYFGA